MEELPQLGDGSSSAGSSRGAFLYLPSSAVATTTTTSAPPPPRSAVYEQSYYYYPTSHPYFHTPPPKTEAGSSQFQTSRVETLSQGVISQSDIEEIKARIMSHPRYSTLLGAFVDCQKVGAPPEVVERLSAIAHELASRPRFHSGSYPDPELDQFMESYCEMLIKYREELTRPLQEATDFLKKMESQFNALTNTSTRGIFSSGIPKDEKCGGGGGGGGVDSSTEEEQDASGGEAELREIDPHAEDKELKHHLLKKYGSYLSSLRQQLSKKKKKEKLPKDARQKLLHWWELHYTWPYPSEAEKVAMAESTGLDQKQINNWFINQRKRHWKPSADMQFALMDGFHPQNAAAALYTQWQSMGDGTYHLHP